MKLPIRYEPGIGLLDDSGKLITDFADSDFDLDADDVHAVELVVSRNCHDALVGACQRALTWFSVPGDFESYPDVEAQLKAALELTKGHRP